LVYGNECHTGADLTIPHPGIVQRNFVLYPLAEVAPELFVAGAGRVADLAGSIARDGLWPMNDDWQNST
jgi:2-amino-4-hydroxy-6-hydroxymethyldihydropteridine diphosphokinase